MCEHQKRRKAGEQQIYRHFSEAANRSMQQGKETWIQFLTPFFSLFYFQHIILPQVTHFIFYKMNIKQNQTLVYFIKLF